METYLPRAFVKFTDKRIKLRFLKKIDVETVGTPVRDRSRAEENDNNQS